MSTMLPQGSAWTPELIEIYYEAIEKIAREYGLDTYPNQLELITWEQMVDAYTSTGLPMMYNHWTFGMEFTKIERSYRKGESGLAYELVINSDPCISYLMENNTMTMQALVIAHAAFGHNSFFKGNYLFREWTDAKGFMNYLEFAKNYIAQCEERYGTRAVELVLDSAHALRSHGVDRFKKPKRLSPTEELVRLKERAKFMDANYDPVLATTALEHEAVKETVTHGVNELKFMEEENLLYFLEKQSPALENWEREILRIVRKIAQYFYPQGQTKVMNEGWACFWHYTILRTMEERGLVGPGFMLEFFKDHTNVVSQLGFDHKYFNGINPYALGFRMFQEIRRVCEHPTDEDREWLPDIAGTDWRKTLEHAMRNHRDESFIAQYLTPKLIREFRLFALQNDSEKDHYEVLDIHDPEGYKHVRSVLARQYDFGVLQPNIEVRSLDPVNGALTLVHKMHDGWPLSQGVEDVVFHFYQLWQRPVQLLAEYEVDGEKVTEQLCQFEFD